MSDAEDRIVVTGAGLWSPFAPTREESWAAILEGRSAVRWIDTACGEVRDAEAVTNLSSAAGAPAALRPRRNVAPTMAIAVVREALAHARLDWEALPESRKLRVGCAFGASKGSFDQIAASREESNAGDHSPDLSLLAPSASLDAVLSDLRFSGPATCPVAACATGGLAILQGARWIEQDRCDAVLVGSSDAALQSILLASYRRMGVLARIDETPATAVRPFDRRRSGFLVGEGAAALVLERWSHARDRGVTPLAEWGGGISLSDATGLLSLDRSGSSVGEAIRRLLDRAGGKRDGVDVVGLHGTGTLENDLSEGRGVRSAFGTAAARLSGFSLKGAIGHLLGAAGSVEGVASVLALRDQIVPPTVNCDHPDPECVVGRTGPWAERRDIGGVLKLSLGFGGHVSAILFHRWPTSA